MTRIPRTFIRLVTIQQKCWDRGHRAWARSLGARIQGYLADMPQLRKVY